MRILAIETTDKTGSVAAMADDNLLADLMLDRTQRSAQSLAPAISRLLKQVGWLPADVQLVAVSIGPGSFTGLRVGVTAAKVFAYAVGAEVLGVNTLEAVAANAQGSTAGDDPRDGIEDDPSDSIEIAGSQRLAECAKPGDSPPGAVGSRLFLNAEHPSRRIHSLSVVIDAQRGEVVVQSFVRQADGWFEPAGAEELLDAEVWLERLKTVGSRQSAVGSDPPSAFRLPPCSNPQSPIPNPSVITGPGLVRLLDRLPPGVAALEEAYWHPRAAAVGRIAARYHAQGRRDDLWKLVPHYYRRSAAEEKWDARMAKQ
jgi:tRNA threonylcarbamoyladenosine biosynthesis protein TsaB